jgi:hypothetical protein
MRRAGRSLQPFSGTEFVPRAVKLNAVGITGDEAGRVPLKPATIRG